MHGLARAWMYYCRGRFIAPTADLSRPPPIYRAHRRFIAPTADLSRPPPIYQQCEYNLT
ncbi:MAG: hypothetical protein ACYDER_25025 [Ktedonobacteraceae bacterium]